MTIAYHHLFRTNHLQKYIVQPYLPKKRLSVDVSVEQDCTHLSRRLMDLLGLLVQQENDSIVGGSERIANSFVFLTEADLKRFFSKHRM